jgi:hypothetical protein
LEVGKCYEVNGEKIKGVDMSPGYRLKFFDSQNCDGVYHAFGVISLFHTLGNKKDIKSVKVMNEFGIDKKPEFLHANINYIELVMETMLALI